MLVGNGDDDAVGVEITGAIDITNAGVTSINAEQIDSDHYVDGSIDNEHLADNAVGTDKIANDAVTMAKIDEDSNYEDFTGNIATTGFLNGGTKPVLLTNTSGVHDGAGDATTLSDSGESFTSSQFVGMTVYNKTDGSSCTVTANDGTTITCTLSGGSEDDWDVDDVWQVGPGLKQSGTAFYIAAAGTIRHPATAGYAALYYIDAAATLTIDPVSASTLIKNATASAIDAGDSIDSPSTAGSFITLHNASATVAYALGIKGTWTDGGAD